MSRVDQELLAAPRWKPEHLGVPIPPSPHAVSVCLPTWRDVEDYERKTPRVISRLQAGYPRFVLPPAAAEFFEHARKRLGKDDEHGLAFPTHRAAERCVRFIRVWSGSDARIVPWPGGSAFLVLYPSSARDAALKYWRHTGDGISSRRAQDLMAGRQPAESAAAQRAVRARIAKLLSVPASQVFLFPAGMAAIYAVHRALERRRPGTPCVQFGFPYVDTLKILQELGAGSRFFPRGDVRELNDLGAALQREPAAGVFCEFPSNPLLSTPDVKSLLATCRPAGVPLVIDETIASYANANLVPGADIVVSSLTKFFTGRGDVMAGAAVVNPASPLGAELHAHLSAEYEDMIWGGDAVLIEEYSRDFVERMQKVNATTLRVCEWLTRHPCVDRVYYPGLGDRTMYDAFRLPRGGYSGLFSVLLKDPQQRTARFYDALRFNKGPNLGTTFSLACPFTMLAHFDELDWAESCGVSRYLVRFSVGLEEAADLIARLDQALAT